MDAALPTPDTLPTNSRVTFLLKHRADLWNWALIPLYAGLITAPFYDHRSEMEQGGFILALIAASLLWGRYFSRWIERRVGIFRERSVYPARRTKIAFLPEAKIWGAMLVITASIVFLRRNSAHYPHHGWIEHAVGVWISLAILFCLRRSFDATNLPRRRLWNLVAAGVLITGWSFDGTSPQSYAVLLVLLGATNLTLALLDVGLLIHLARTPRSDETEEAHA